MKEHGRAVTAPPNPWLQRTPSAPLSRKPFGGTLKGICLCHLAAAVVLAMAACSTAQPCVNPNHTDQPVRAPFEVPAGFWDTHAEGRVTLKVMVGVDGRVSSPRIIQSPGPDYSRIAVENVMRWRYQPLVCNGIPTAVPVTVTIDFLKRPDNG